MVVSFIFIQLKFYVSFKFGKSTYQWDMAPPMKLEDYEDKEPPSQI